MNKGALILNEPDKVYAKIKKLTSEEYIDTLNLTTEKIEAFCAENILNMDNKTKDDYVEKKCKPPLMAAYFYYYIYYYQKLPTQKEFRSFYARLNFKWMAEKIGRKYREAFEARLDRFYASIMRDIHFYHLAKENIDLKLEFTLENDIESKIDLLLKDEKMSFGLQLRVDTDDSLNYSLLKEERISKKLDNVTLIDFPINLGKAKRVKTKKDDFLFYDKSSFEKINSFIKEKKKQ